MRGGPRHAFSLRWRLTAIILLPLMALAVLLGFLQLNDARRTAGEVFDRALLSAALAVANDVAVSGGDALSVSTRGLLADTSGGRVFYHVYAPDGVIVTGYATPPVGIPRRGVELARPNYFNAVYLGRPVRGVRIQNRAEVEGIAGIVTTTVWQDRSVRSEFVLDLVFRSFLGIAALISALGVIVWFGVRIGLRPLEDLQDAIALRSSEELAPIRRPVPEECAGIVHTLNRLFAQVSGSMTARDEFVSNAAHQLRNPIAGVLSLAEAVHGAPTAEAAKQRSADLLQAARDVAGLSQKLLALERAKSMTPEASRREVDLATHLRDLIRSFGRHAPTSVTLRLTIEEHLGLLRCDPVMLSEAIVNLLDNALLHGGDALTEIRLGAERKADHIDIWVSDDGSGIPQDKLSLALERFTQLGPTSRSGLGLSIVQAVVDGHGGSMELYSTAKGLRVQMSFPLVQRETTAPYSTA